MVVVAGALTPRPAGAQATGLSADLSKPGDPAAEPEPRPPTPVPATGLPAPSGSPAGTSTGIVPSPSPHYDKGFVLVPSVDPVEMPFQLKLNHVSQFRYTNTKNVDSTYVDNLGNSKPVMMRNDVQLTRDVFYFSGFAFDPRLDFNILVYTSSATLSATAAGYIGFVFSKAFALRAGFFSLPSVRSFTGTYPYFHSTDRSMANDYMRPGFTQGVWANGEPLPGINYIAMIGNSLNTLDIGASRIDQNFAYSASVWYDRNEFGKPWNDQEGHDKLSLRLGTAFTYAREDRLSDLSKASPENNSIFISDGSLLFATGALAPNVTVQLANYYLWAVDAGMKYRGLAVNVEVYQRWLNHFSADGPLPTTSMFDWGFEASAGYFAIPGTLEPYVRTSVVLGASDRNSYEVAGGANWYPLHVRGVWLNLEVIDISKCPYASALYVYSVGQTGTLVQSQVIVRF